MTNSPEHANPTVSIGLPVYNGDRTIARVIGSLIGQTYSDFELIISDNASTDETEEICKAYAENDSRIRYVRQSSNIGPGKNFQFVLDQSVGEYFMWVSDDDMRTSGYIEENVKILKANLDCSFSSSPNCYAGDEENPDKLIVFSLEGDLYNRISGFIDNAWQSHACFYSLMRREYLDGRPDIFGDYLAGDWVIDVLLLIRGSFKRTAKEMLIIGRSGASMHPDFLDRLRIKPIHHVFPMYDFSVRVIKIIRNAKELGMGQWMALYFKLLGLNAFVLKNKIRHKLATSIKRVLGWQNTIDN